MFARKELRDLMHALETAIECAVEDREYLVGARAVSKNVAGVDHMLDVVEARIMRWMDLQERVKHELVEVDSEG